MRRVSPLVSRNAGHRSTRDGDYRIGCLDAPRTSNVAGTADTEADRESFAIGPFVARRYCSW